MDNSGLLQQYMALVFVVLDNILIGYINLVLVWLVHSAHRKTFSGLLEIL